MATSVSRFAIHSSRKATTNSFRPTSPPAPTAGASYSIRVTAATATPSSTAPTAARVSPSSMPSPTTGPTLRCASSPCATPAAPNMKTPPTAASTRNPTPVLCAGRTCGWKRMSEWANQRIANYELRITNHVSRGTRLHSNGPEHCCWTAKLWRSRGWAGFIWRAMRPMRRRCGRCGSASAGPTSRLRLWSPRWMTRARSVTCRRRPRRYSPRHKRPLSYLSGGRRSSWTTSRPTTTRSV